MMENEPATSVVSATTFKDAQMLIDACKYNDCERLKNEIWNGIDVNSQESTGWSALAESATFDHVDCMELLISKGADINIQDKDGGTPLMQAVQSTKGDKCANLLVRSGAQLDLQDQWGCSPLHCAVDMANASSVALLVDAGINVNLRDQRGFTALHTACRRHTSVAEEQIIPILMRGGADSHIRNKKGQVAHEVCTTNAAWSRKLRKLLSSLEAEREAGAHCDSTTALKSLKSASDIQPDEKVDTLKSANRTDDNLNSSKEAADSASVALVKNDMHTFSECSSSGQSNIDGCEQEVQKSLSAIAISDVAQPSEEVIGLKPNVKEACAVSVAPRKEENNVGGIKHEIECPFPLSRKLLDLQAARDYNLISAEEFLVHRARVLTAFLEV